MRTVYLDLDGVVANFDQRYLDVTGVEFASISSPTERWGKLKGKEKGFYEGILPYKGYEAFVDKLLAFLHEGHFRIHVLTALPLMLNMPSAGAEKAAWCHKYLPKFPTTLCRFSQDKQYMAKHGDILIDDNPRNVAQWMKQGGIAIRHLNFDDTRIQLEELLSTY
jgi:5'(3')-deoxyribonucleotidase